MRVALAILVLVCLGCVATGASAPYVAPPPNVEPPPDYCVGVGEDVDLWNEPVGSYVVGTGEDLVRVTAPGGARWAHVAAPVGPAGRAQLLALFHVDAIDASCASVLVVPFADTNRAAVFTTRFVRVVRFSEWRVRELDQVGATLEGCRMDQGADELVCSLDLSFDEARFDPDGEERTGSFRPRWRWAGYPLGR